MSAETEGEMQDNADKKAQERNVMERDQDDGRLRSTREPGDVQKDGLEGVEPDGAVLIVGRQHQEQNSGDETKQVAERTGHVVGHSDTLAPDGRRHRIGPRADLRLVRAARVLDRELLARHRRAAFLTKPSVNSRTAICAKGHSFTPLTHFIGSLCLGKTLRVFTTLYSSRSLTLASHASSNR
jgi:hypothetical protein